MTYAHHSAKAMEKKEDKIRGDSPSSSTLATTSTKKWLPRDIGVAMPPLHKKVVVEPPTTLEERIAFFQELMEEKGFGKPKIPSPQKK